MGNKQSNTKTSSPGVCKTCKKGNVSMTNTNIEKQTSVNSFNHITFQTYNPPSSQSGNLWEQMQKESIPLV